MVTLKEEAGMRGQKGVFLDVENIAHLFYLVGGYMSVNGYKNSKAVHEKDLHFLAGKWALNVSIPFNPPISLFVK